MLVVKVLKRTVVYDPLESEIKREICDYLALRRDLFFWVQESQGTFDPRKKIFRKKNSKYQKNGVPDINVFMKFHTWPLVYVGLEVKRKKGVQTPSQLEFEIDFKKFGGFYFVIRSSEDARKALKCVTDHLTQFYSVKT